MDINTQYSYRIPHFHGRTLPEPGCIAGYAAIITALDLPVPPPDQVAIISERNKQYRENGWLVFPPKYRPEESLYRHLVFALKYEGINLLLFKKLFLALDQSQILELLRIEPTGQYSRKIWFLYEWLMDEKLDIPDLKIKNPIPLIDEKLQYAIPGKSSPRHRIINNLPGIREFCPLIRKTDLLVAEQKADWSQQKQSLMGEIHRDIIQRAAAFLLLKDSKASFTIEGERPPNRRAQRWGEAIGQAGSQPLSKGELLRLQAMVIEDDRFTAMGFRTEGGFVGAHDRSSGEPIPDHISARWEDVENLIEALIATDEVLETNGFDAVLAATATAFGFVFIHPFVDGNGRIHRYLIHHILTRLNMTDPGLVFPVSAAMLNNLPAYHSALESYSKPLLEWIEWRATSGGNVEVLNDTADYYRYFDATVQAEYLYSCVRETVETIIPDEVKYLLRYEEIKNYLDTAFDMPDKLVALLIRFLEQNNGKLSKRVLSREFSQLATDEVRDIEIKFNEIFLVDDGSDKDQ